MVAPRRSSKAAREPSTRSAQTARPATSRRPARQHEVVNPVDAYARDVVEGRVPAGKYHRLACERHLKDRQRENTAGFPYRFVWEARDEQGRLGQCALRFFTFARRCRHYKGEWAGKPFEPSPFQIFALGLIFGWRHVETGLRRFTTAYFEWPRKQGKSFVAAVVALYTTFFEGEPGAEGYCLATKEKQAADVVFRDAKQIVKASGLTRLIKVAAKNLSRADTVSKLEPLGSDSDTLDGLNPHSITIDELHAFKTRGLIDVMETATGARRNPLEFMITTAGSDPVSPCGDQHDYACKILEGVLDDDPATLSFCAVIAHADPDDDPFAEDTWRKANPHYGLSVKPEDIAKLAAKAKHMPSAAAEFKQKRLNIWVTSDQPWLSLEGWRKGQTTWSLEEMRGERCWIGLDLSSKIDLTALVLVFPPTPSRETFRIWPFVWTPAETLIDRAHRDRAPYDIWVQQGHLLTVPGASIKHRVVREKILELRDIVDIAAIGFDRWHAESMIDELEDDDGFPGDQLVEVPQTFAGLSAASRRLEAEVLEGRVDAAGSPVMAWCVSNAVVQPDGKDNIQPIKKRSRGRIDPVVATVIALAVYLRMPEAKGKKRKPSVYQKRGAYIITAEGAQLTTAPLDDMETL